MRVRMEAKLGQETPQRRGKRKPFRRELYMGPSLLIGLRCVIPGADERERMAGPHTGALVDPSLELVGATTGYKQSEHSGALHENIGICIGREGE